MSEGNDLVRKMWFFVVEDIKRIVVGISEDYLYCENLKKRIGDCSIGDNSVLSLSEQKLILTDSNVSPKPQQKEMIITMKILTD